MTIQFTPSMPNVGSWNGRWSGESNLYAVVRSISKKAWAERILAKKSYYYNFGDGWGASISVQRIDSSTSRSVRKRSRGFCGYEWMVDSIIYDGEIYGPTRPKPATEPTVSPARPVFDPVAAKAVSEAVLALDKDCPF